MTTPAVEVRSFSATIPAGTAESSPHVTQVEFPARKLVGVHWKVPPGPSGLMGWRLTMSGGNAVIPTGGGWVVSDDDADTWAVTGQPDSGQWEISGYNTDSYDHTVYITFLLDLVTTPPAITVIPSSASLSSPASAGTAGVPAG